MAKRVKHPTDGEGDQSTVAEDRLIMNAATLTGDLRDFVLDRLKHDHNPLPWQMRSEQDQRETIAKVTDVTARWVENAVRVIAAEDRQVMVGTLKQVVVKDGIKAQVDFVASDPSRLALIDAVKLQVLLVVADANAFIGTRGDVKINHDQADLLPKDDESPSDDMWA